MESPGFESPGAEVWGGEVGWKKGDVGLDEVGKKRWGNWGSVKTHA